MTAIGASETSQQYGVCGYRAQQEDLGARHCDARARSTQHPSDRWRRSARACRRGSGPRRRTGLRILVCYEAGYDGFWVARSLAKENIECRVLDPASIQVNRRARRVKTDRIDVLMLLRALIAIDRGERHVCAVVRVPSIEEEDARRPIASASALSASAPVTSTGSRGFSSLRAFGGSSPSGGRPESTLRR